MNKYKLYLWLAGISAVLILCSLMLFMFSIQIFTGLTTSSHSAKNESLLAPIGLSARVPPVFASIFTEAGQKTGVAPAMVAAIYLTEHHTDTFGKDLPNTEYAQPSCKENYAGAAGPMQFITSSWNGVVDDLKKVGINNPDRCKYRDSIIGAAFLLKGKLKYDWVQEACKTTNLAELDYTDSCISRWGQSYCGINACHDPACGGVKYPYCEMVVKKYHLVAV